jgi:hypothetical protein
MNKTACAPVLVTVFNRPSETAQVLDRLRLVKPRRIFLSADGPRPGHPGDAAKCQEVRALLAQNIDWDADVYTDFSPDNLGLRRRMGSAISWALERVDRIIILEDDCIPEITFFRFCTELLHRYANDGRIGAITGDNFQPRGFDCGASYYFSRYAHCWGWATWRRAWKLYDDAMSDWPQVRNSDWLNQHFSNSLEALYWRQLFDGTYEGKIQSWAYRWTYSFWRHGMLAATPAKNLVCNIGTGPAATNTRDHEEDKHGRLAQDMDFPLQHPLNVERHIQADRFAQQKVFGRAKDPSMAGRLKRLLIKIKKGLAPLRRCYNG